MTPQELKKLNKQFIQFGFNPHGEANYRWIHSTDIFFMLETGRRETRLSPGGIYYEQNIYERRPWADHYGPRWMIVRWSAPEMSEGEWLRKFDSAFPWPKHGEYHPIDSAILPEGEEPDEKLTQLAVRRLYEHLGLSYRDHLDASKNTAAAVQKDKSGEWNDLVDDAFPAFGNVPGKKEHVSFPNHGYQ